MKTSTVLILIAIAFVTTTSCRKERDVTLTKTINVNLSSGQTYSYNVQHTGDADDEMQITEQPAHGTASMAPVAASGGTLFSYVAAAGYSGSDVVQVSNVENHQGHGGGQCGGRHGEHMVYIFNIRINSGGNTVMRVHYPFRGAICPVF